VAAHPQPAPPAGDGPPAAASSLERTFQARALAQLHDAVVGTDEHFVIHTWNRAAERLYGLPAAEAVGRPLGEVMADLTAGAIDETMRRLQAEREISGLVRRWRKDGTPVDVDLRVCAVEDGQGRVVGYVGIHRDVTEQLRREQAYRSAVAQVELLTSRAPAGIFQVDAEGRLVFLSEMLCALTGLPPEQLVGAGWIRAVHEADRRRVLTLWREALAANATFRAEFRMGAGDGAIWVFATAMVLRDADGRPAGVLGVVTDVTETHRLQDRLDKAERMASVGTLAAGMAHEINNPLACVTSSVDYAAEELAGKPGLAEAAEALADARDAAARVAHIVRELQAFAGVREEVQAVDLGEALRGALLLVPEALRSRAREVLELGETPPVMASRQQLERLLHHLLRNAFQSIPADRAGRAEVRALTRAAADGRALVEIRDQGEGIPAGQLPRIFDPFYTTREVGQGAGLGLSVCFSLVAAMKGEVEVESEEGKGSTFRLLLPAAGAAHRTPAPTPDRALAAPASF